MLRSIKTAGVIVTSHRDLIAYQKAVELQQAVFETSKTFPKEKMYALTDQSRRSSQSIGANIAEAWRKRRYEALFVSKLTDADGENAETEHWLDTSLKCGYIGQAEHGALVALSAEVGKLIGSIIQTAPRWCVAALSRLHLCATKLTTKLTTKMTRPLITDHFPLTPTSPLGRGLLDVASSGLPRTVSNRLFCIAVLAVWQQRVTYCVALRTLLEQDSAADRA